MSPMAASELFFEGLLGNSEASFFLFIFSCAFSFGTLLLALCFVLFLSSLTLSPFLSFSFQRFLHDSSGVRVLSEQKVASNPIISIPISSQICFGVG